MIGHQCIPVTCMIWEGITNSRNNMATTKQAPQSTDSEGENSQNTFTGEQSTSLLTSTTFDTTSSRLNATRIELERRQLTHSIQLLNLELSQKNLLIEALKTEHSSTVEELEEKLSDAVCERNLLQQRLRAMTNVYEEELEELRKQRNEHTVHVSREETDSCEKWNKDETESSISEKVKMALQRPLLSEEEYEKHFKNGEVEMDISELTRVRMFEASRPFVIESEGLRNEVQRLRECLSEEEERVKKVNKVLEDSRNELSRLSARCEELSLANGRLTASVKDREYKTATFDTIKDERDVLQREMDAVRRALVEKEIGEKFEEEQKRKLQEELSSALQSVALLKQDKDYLSKQLSDTSQRCREVEERNVLMQEQLADIKLSKENLYEQFINTRQQQKEDYNQQLTEELESIRRKTSLEMEQVRVQTREMFERENRVLLQSKERADTDRDRAGHRAREVEEKYEQLLNEFRQLQVSSEGQISDLQSELQMKVFECERSHLLQEETTRTLSSVQKEKIKLKEKVESLGEQLRILSAEKDSKIRDCETSLKQVSQRLETYESLERELDDVVMQAAEIENEQDAERVLFSFGFGTSVPSTSRRRMQQSVQLARRVLKLERINVSLRQQLEAIDMEKRELEGKISSMSSQLDLSHQPQKYLVETLQSRDKEMEAIRNRNWALEARTRELEKERNHLIETKNQLSLDLERLLNHNEELNMMKQMIVTLSKGSNKKEPCYHKRVGMETEDTPLQPKPMIFTREEAPPLWYKKLSTAQECN